MPGLSHPEAQRAHARRRLEERFGENLSPADYEFLAARVALGHFPVFARCKDKIVYRVEIHGKTAFACFHTETKEICTWLTEAQAFHNFYGEAV